MKRLITAFPFLFCNLLSGNSANPDDGYHGETQSCVSCHSSYPLNSGDGGISISGLPATYLPGQTYNLALSVSGTNTDGYGFQMIPKANGNPSGTLSAISSGMGIENGYAEHRGASITGVWNFQWTAPLTDEGTITFHASGIATGGTRSNQGDYVYTFSESIEPNPFAQVSMDWNASTDGVIFSSPALSPDGTIYVGSNDNKLHAINPDGSSKWTFTTGNWVDSTPSVGPDGTIYFGSWDNKLYAIDPTDGTMIWEYETNSYITASPAIGADGKIYFGSHDSIFYALENNGSLAWEYFAGNAISSSAALGQDGTIYFGDGNGTLHAVNPNGTGKWTYEVEQVADTNNSILSSPALDFSGNIYFGSGNGYCYSLSDNSSDASLNWKYQTGDRVDASPVLGLNDDVFFVSRDGYLRSLSTLSGGINWDEFAFVGDVFYSSPAVDAEGRVYVIGYTGGGDNQLSVFESNGSKAWDTNETDSPFTVSGIVDSSLLISENGKLYYGCYDGNLYCVNLGIGLADSDWPVFQGNAKRDGAWPSFSLELAASPEEGGETTGSGIYNPGASASIAAIPTEGYSFVEWLGTGPVDSLSANTTVEVSSDLNLTAVFALDTFEVQLSMIPEGVAALAGNGTYNSGEAVTLSVVSIDPGYEFNRWSGTLISSENPLVLNLYLDLNLTANFEQITYELVVSAGPGGSASGSGNLPYGENGEITASPDEGYVFSSWTGEGIADINASVTTISMTEDRNVTANFSLDSHQLYLSTNGEGTVSGSGIFSHGDIVTISAEPNSGYTFSNWLGDGVSDPLAATTTVTMTDERNVTAVFSINSYSLSITAGEGGNVDGDGNYTYGSVVDISATPNEGYSFDSWHGAEVASSVSAQTTVTVLGDLSLAAVFQVNEYTLSASPVSGGTITGLGVYEHGSLVNLNAIPESGYVFVRWIGPVLDENASSTSIVVDEEIQISAVFEEKPLEEKSLVLTSFPSYAGTTSGSGSFLENSTVSISATPAQGYEFTFWSGLSSDDSNSSSTSLLLTSDLNLTANFSPLSYILEINASEGGTVSGAGTYDFGSLVEISAVPNDGYRFTGWSEGTIANPLLSETSIEITSNLSIAANFSINQYVVTLLANEGGSVQGSGTYDHGSEVSIVAIANNGYKFTGWTGAELSDPSDNSTSFQIGADYELTANFEKILISNMEGVTSLEADWHDSNWLGFFYYSTTGWCYHLGLGWIFPVPIEDGSIWAWSPKLEWLWLSPLTFPQSLIWSRNDVDWIYLHSSGSPEQQIFHYKNESWSSFDPNAEISLEDSIF